MAWSASKIFVALIEDALENTVAAALAADSFKVTLWDNDITPDNTVSAANSTYAAGQWVSSGNEVSDGTEWDVAGEPLASPTFVGTSNVIKFDGTDTVSGGTSATLANVYGCAIFDTSIASRGVSYHYFGGVQSVGGRLN